MIWAAGSSNARDARAEAAGGLTTSADCEALPARLRAFQLSVYVTRRKSSGLISAGAPATAAAVGQALAGGVAPRPSFGSSNVQTSAATV